MNSISLFLTSKFDTFQLWVLIDKNEVNCRFFFLEKRRSLFKRFNGYRCDSGMYLCKYRVTWDNVKSSLIFVNSLDYNHIQAVPPNITEHYRRLKSQPTLTCMVLEKKKNITLQVLAFPKCSLPFFVLLI